MKFPEICFSISASFSLLFPPVFPPFSRSIFDLILEPKWTLNELLLGTFSLRKRWPKRVRFRTSKKSTPGPNMMLLGTPRISKIIKKRQENIGFRENRFFRSELPCGSTKYQKRPKNEPKMVPNMVKNVTKSLSKKTSSVSQKWGRKRSQK